MKRRESVYSHTHCTDNCKQRGKLQFTHSHYLTRYTIYTGCGRLWVTDGIWKLAFPHCTFRVEVSIILRMMNFFNFRQHHPNEGKHSAETTHSKGNSECSNWVERVYWRAGASQPYIYIYISTYGRRARPHTVYFSKSVKTAEVHAHSLEICHKEPYIAAHFSQHVPYSWLQGIVQPTWKA